MGDTGRRIYEFGPFRLDAGGAAPAARRAQGAAGAPAEGVRPYARALSHTLGAEGEARVAGALREAYMASGPDGLFRRQVELLQAEARRDPNFPIHMAEAYTRLGDRGRALEWLGRAIAERHPAIHLLHLDPDFESLRPDPRFAELLRRAALP